MLDGATVVFGAAAVVDGAPPAAAPDVPIAAIPDVPLAARPDVPAAEMGPLAPATVVAVAVVGAVAVAVVGAVVGEATLELVEEATVEEVADEEVADEEVADEEVADEEVADEEVADEEVADEEGVEAVLAPDVPVALLVADAGGALGRARKALASPRREATWRARLSDVSTMSCSSIGTYGENTCARVRVVTSTTCGLNHRNPPGRPSKMATWSPENDRK